MRVVTKVLTANDLGLTGAHQAGMHVPKRREILTFFPPLDPSVLNPRAFVSVFCEDSNQYWDFNFIYYNSKALGRGTRNEYRLTKMTAFFREVGYQPSDELILQRDNEGNVSVHRETTEAPIRDSRQATITLQGWRFVPEGEL